MASQHFQDVAAAISRALGAAGPDDLDGAVSESLEHLGSFAEADIAFAAFVDDDGRICDRWDWVRPGHPVARPPAGIPLHDVFGSMAEILRLGQPVAVDDLTPFELLPTEQALVDGNRIRAILVVPVLTGHTLVGVVGLHVQDHVRAWTTDDVARVELVAQLVSQCVQRHRDHGALALADLRARRIAEYLPDGLLFLADDWSVRWASPSFQRTWSMGEHLLDVVHPDDRALLRTEERHGRARVRILSGEGHRWTDVTWQPATDPFAEDPDEVVVTTRDVHDQHLAAQRLTTAAHVDALTGLANRTGLDRALVGLTSRGADVLVAFCDVDRFKAVNDADGHTAGDDALVGVARGLRGAVRPDDLVARVGGDEFVVVVTDPSPPTVAELGSRLVDAVRDATGGRATVSVGLSAVGPASDVDRLRQQADEAMYAAKRSGRDTWSRV